MNFNKTTYDYLINATNLSKQNGPIVCLQDASIEVRPGEVIAVLGSNGSGKTTLCDLLSGFITPDTGTITLKDKHVKNWGPAWFGAQGVLRSFQTPRVFNQMNIWEILLLSARVFAPPSLVDIFWWRTSANILALQEAEKAAKAILDRVGWTNYRERKAQALSYGQQKLLASLTLRMASGTIAICDEPIAGLDKDHAATVLDLLLEWKNEDSQRAVIITTHDLEYSGLKADRMLRMERGILTE